MLSLAHQTFRLGPHAITVACRQPPEELSRCTLTLQDDASDPPAQRQASRQCDGGGGGVGGGMPDPLPGPVAADLIGLDLWPASLALCQYLLANPQLVAGRALLELGAGMGLPGILAAKQGAASVCLTDYEPLVLEHLSSNLVANGVAGTCTTQQLDWLRLGDLPPTQLGAWRLVLAADVLYASVIVKPFVGALQALLHPEGAALVAHQIRRAITLDPKTRLPRLEETDEPFEGFLLTCREAGLQMRILSSRETCSNVDSDPMVLVAVAKCDAALEALPAWEHSADGSQSGVGKRDGG